MFTIFGGCYQNTICFSSRKRGIFNICNSSLLTNRFTCCHEIAHTLSFKGESEKVYKRCLVNVWEKKDPEETLCNKIAAELLLPANVFIEFANKLEPSISSLQELSKIFRVSLKVVMWRVLNKE